MRSAPFVAGGVGDFAGERHAVIGCVLTGVGQGLGQCDQAVDKPLIGGVGQRGLTILPSDAVGLISK